MSANPIIEHVTSSIGRASVAHAEAARARVAGAGAPMLERLAAQLAGAQHTPRPRGERRVICVVAGDHAAGDPGIALGADHPTIVAARAIADGSAALAQLARAAHTPIVLADAGVREPAHLPGIAVPLDVETSHATQPSLAIPRSLATQPGLATLRGTGRDRWERPLVAGIALAVSLAEGEPLAVLALGAIGVGAELASAEILGAVTGVPPVGLGDPEAEAAGARATEAAGADAFELLARFGAPQTAALVGLMLGAASMNIAVVLDGHATGAAALLAAKIAPAVAGYLIAAHRGSFTMKATLAQLGLAPIFEVGLGHGEGAGAAMLLPLVDQVASLVRE